MSWDNNHPSSGGAAFSFNVGDSEDKKRKQDEDDIKLMKDLLSQGYPTDAAQYIVNKHHNTGVLDLQPPNFQNTLQRGSQPNRAVPLPPVTDIPERSTLKDFQPMEQDAVGTYDAQNPTKLNLLRVPRGTNVRSLIPTNKPEKAPPDPEKQAALNELKIFQKKAAARDSNGDPYQFTPEEIDQVQSAAETLGIPYTPGQEKAQSWWQKLVGSAPQVTPPTLFKSPNDNGDLQSDLADAQAAISKKLVTRDEALRRLRKKHGTKVTLP